MALKIIGNNEPFGVDIVEMDGGRSVLKELAARQLRVVIDNHGARLELDQAVDYDFSVPDAVRAFLPCPVTKTRREIASVTLKDGGVICFPRKFSSRDTGGAGDDGESLHEALPKCTSGT